MLSSPLRDNPPVPPGELRPFTVVTQAGTEVSADVWFRCYGVSPVSDYLVGELAAARRPDGFVEVTPFLQVAGQDRVFAVGDVSTADHKMAGAANRQAQVIADNIRTLISGEGDLRPHEPAAPGIVVPIGPHGGSGQRPNTDELVPAETVAELKGRDLMVARFAGLFGITPPDAEADAGR